MKTDIRRATPKDALIIAQFNFALAKETERLSLDRKRLLKGVKGLLKDTSKGFYLLALSGGRVAGQLMITYEWSDWRNATFWWIQSVYVAPEFRGSGIFSQLFHHIEKVAKRKGAVCGLRLYVEHGNALAQKRYERLGMIKANYGMYEIDFVIRRIPAELP